MGGIWIRAFSGVGAAVGLGADPLGLSDGVPPADCDGEAVPDAVSDGVALGLAVSDGGRRRAAGRRLGRPGLADRHVRGQRAGHRHERVGLDAVVDDDHPEPGVGAALVAAADRVFQRGVADRDPADLRHLAVDGRLLRRGLGDLTGPAAGEREATHDDQPGQHGPGR